MIQIDMDIPKTCDDCPFHIYHSGNNYVCVATPLFYPMNLANYKDGRKDFCPLIEVAQEPRIITCKDCKYYRNKGNKRSYCTKRLNVDSVTDRYREPSFYCADAVLREVEE